eukprot:6299069-Amphidinium_carterae.1
MSDLNPCVHSSYDRPLSYHAIMLVQWHVKDWYSTCITQALDGRPIYYRSKCFQVVGWLVFFVCVPSFAGLSVASESVCAVLDDASLKCWGSNVNGQLGLADSFNRGDGVTPGYGVGDELPAISLGSGALVSQVAAGPYSSCALLTTGEVKCWGAGGYLGLGDSNSRGVSDLALMGDALPALDLGSGLVVDGITTGIYHSCALFTNGQMKCWGVGTSGQLGSGSTDQIGDSSCEMGDFLSYVSLHGYTEYVNYYTYYAWLV